MKKNIKKWKIILIATISIIAILFGGMTARGEFFYDHLILQVFVRENPFTTPQQETFSILQIFEENGFTQERIHNVQLAVLPEGEAIIITNQEHIQVVWDTLSEIKVTTRGATQAQINDERAIYVDFQFLNPYYNLGIEMFGQIYILGRGPFVFEEGYCEQPFIDLFTELSTIYVESTLDEPIEEYDEIEIVIELPQEDILNDLDPNDYSSTENENLLNYTTLIE